MELSDGRVISQRSEAPLFSPCALFKGKLGEWRKMKKRGEKNTALASKISYPSADSRR